jgi:hypothetical protein
MIPQEAFDDYARVGGDWDYAAHLRMTMTHFAEIDALLLRLHIMDAGYAADSFRADSLREIEMAGISLASLRDLKTLADKADAKKRKHA